MEDLPVYQEVEDGRGALFVLVILEEVFFLVTMVK